MIRVLFFAAAADAAGLREYQLSCAVDGMTEAEFWKVLCAALPSLAGIRNGVRLAKNCAYCRSGERFAPGDEVALIPPVSGG